MNVFFDQNPTCQCGEPLENHKGNLLCPSDKFPFSKYFVNTKERAKNIFREMKICGSTIFCVKAECDKSLLYYQNGELYDDGSFLPSNELTQFCPSFKAEWFYFYL